MRGEMLGAEIARENRVVCDFRFRTNGSMRLVYAEPVLTSPQNGSVPLHKFSLTHRAGPEEMDVLIRGAVSDEVAHELSRVNRTYKDAIASIATGPHFHGDRGAYRSLAGSVLDALHGVHAREMAAIVIPGSDENIPAPQIREHLREVQDASVGRLVATVRENPVGEGVAALLLLDDHHEPLTELGLLIATDEQVQQLTGVQEALTIVSFDGRRDSKVQQSARELLLHI